MPRLAIIGMGKMGRSVAQLAAERSWPVVASFGSSQNERGAAITRENLRGAEVAIEFTTPSTAPHNVRACVKAGCPVVVGTTGWDAERTAVESDVVSTGGAMLWAPNFSIGVNIFWQVAELAASLAAQASGFDAHIVERHHSAKKDAPSGTAIELARRTSLAAGRAIAVTSIRSGSVPGTHEIFFDAPFEQLRVEHVTRDRRVFAEGALSAARWLVGRKGVFTMGDFLSSIKDSP